MFSSGAISNSDCPMVSGAPSAFSRSPATTMPAIGLRTARFVRRCSSSCICSCSRCISSSASWALLVLWTAIAESRSFSARAWSAFSPASSHRISRSIHACQHVATAHYVARRDEALVQCPVVRSHDESPRDRLYLTVAVHAVRTWHAPGIPERSGRRAGPCVRASSRSVVTVAAACATTKPRWSRCSRPSTDAQATAWCCRNASAPGDGSSISWIMPTMWSSSIAQWQTHHTFRTHERNEFLVGQRGMSLRCRPSVAMTWGTRAQGPRPKHPGRH